MSRLIPIACYVLFLTGCAGLMNNQVAAYKEPLSGMDFVYVKGGSFLMGDVSKQRAPEQPLRKARVKGFYVSRHEVTFAAYDQYTAATGRQSTSDNGWGRGNQPVINITWDEATGYADWLSQQTGLQFSLPTETQWEYFARAGTTTPYWTGDTLPENAANCDGCGSRWDNQRPAPVGSFQPNPWGIFDTAGNVAEWVMDDYHDNYLGAPTDGSAWLSPEEQRKVQRGGGWNYAHEDLRSSARDYRVRTGSSHNGGFRLIFVGTPPEPAPGKKPGAAN